MAKITLLSTSSELMRKSQRQYYNNNKRNSKTYNTTSTSSTNEMAKASNSPQGFPTTISYQNYHHDDNTTRQPEYRAIEQILDCTMKKDGCRYYKIRWHDTWEREENLQPFGKKIEEFWGRIEHSRKFDAKNQMRHMTYTDELNSENMTRIHDRPPSPVYRNGTEYSPPPSELGEERSPYTIKSPKDFSPPPPALELSPTPSYDYRNYAEDHSSVDENTLPVLSSGRRKGRPKKLVRDDEEDNEAGERINEEETKENTNLQEKLHIQSTEQELIVEIPSMEPKSHSPHTSEIAEKRSNGSVEEYPVMIIKERSQKTQIHKPDAIRFTEEPPLKRPRAPTPEYERKAPIFVPSTVASFISRADKYTSPVPSPEENTLHRHNTPISPLYQHFGGIPSRFHFSSRHPIFKPVRNQHESMDNVPVIYHTRNMPGRKQSPDNFYMETDTRKYERISGLPNPSKFEASQLLLKVSRPISSMPKHQQEQQKQQFPVYQNIAASVPEPVKTRTTVKDTKTKTPTKYLITADGEQRPQCPECFQTFKKRAALERHMMIHRGIKPFQCHFCNQRFRQKHHLQGHIMLHTGERPHSCTLCNKRFRMRHHLLEHERISHKVFR